MSVTPLFLYLKELDNMENPENLDNLKKGLKKTEVVEVSTTSEHFITVCVMPLQERQGSRALPARRPAPELPESPRE